MSFINLGEAAKQAGSYVGLAPKKDYDIFGGFTDSARPGQRDILTLQKQPDGTTAPAASAPMSSPNVLQVDPDTGAPLTGGYTGGGFTSDSVAADPDAALRETLRNEIMARGGDIDSVYSSLFGELENLVKSRDSELEGQYGNQFKKAGDAYAGAIPEIETSYAAIGAGDSTDKSDAKTKAKTGYEETTRTIGENKATDKAKLGQYKKEQEARIGTDRDSAKRNVARVGETTDVGALRSMRNDIETNLGAANVTKATLGDNGSARKEVSNLTQDAGRFDSAINALDSIIKSSMSGSVKEAAVKAIADNSGLSDDEKKKVNAQYGNVYAEQSAL